MALRVFARNLLRGNGWRNIFISYIVLITNLGYKPGLYYLLDYGEFNGSQGVQCITDRKRFLTPLIVNSGCSSLMVVIMALRVFAKNLLGDNGRRNIFFHISFCCLTWGLNSGLMSNKPTHYLQGYGEFNGYHRFQCITDRTRFLTALIVNHYLRSSIWL